MSLGLVTDTRHIAHSTPSHPESAARLESIQSALAADSELQAALISLDAASASDASILGAHEPALLRMLEALAGDGGGWIDADTYVQPASLEIARIAAGGAIQAVDAVLGGAVATAFSLHRPPGHHATPGRAMGFCLLNNVAIAAQFARREHGLERVAIIDWDVHHGNGTQDIFSDDPAVLYISSHGWPLWPGSGHWREMGSRHGGGATLNLPLMARTGDTGFEQVFASVIRPAVERFRPELLLISAGYDAHVGDPLGNLALSTAGYARLASIVYNLAADCCDGRLVGVLEGGYNLQSLADSVLATLRVWLGLPTAHLEEPLPGHVEPDVIGLIKALQAHHPLVQAR